MSGQFARIPVSAAMGGVGERGLRILITISGRARSHCFVVENASNDYIARTTGIDRRSIHREICKLEAKWCIR